MADTKSKKNSATDITIGSDAGAVQTITVNLVGKKYTIVPPKEAFSLKLAKLVPNLTKMGDIGNLLSEDSTPEEAAEAVAAMDDMMEMINDWVKSTFIRDADKVLARLDDPADRLDIHHIMELLEAVMEYSTEGRPTT